MNPYLIKLVVIIRIHPNGFNWQQSEFYMMTINFPLFVPRKQLTVFDGLF